VLVPLPLLVVVLMLLVRSLLLPLPPLLLLLLLLLLIRGGSLPTRQRRRAWRGGGRALLAKGRFRSARSAAPACLRRRRVLAAGVQRRATPARWAEKPAERTTKHAVEAEGVHAVARGPKTHGKIVKPCGETVYACDVEYVSLLKIVESHRVESGEG
jgi:hypothetical protein